MNHIESYDTGPRILGGILMFASFLPFSVLFFDPPMGVFFFALTFGFVSFFLGLWLLLRIKRKRLDRGRQSVVEEVRWLGKTTWKTARFRPLSHFSCVDVLPTSTGSSSGSGSINGMAVRLLHKMDSKHFYPGKNSWVITCSGHDQAMSLAQAISAETGLDVSDRYLQ